MWCSGRVIIRCRARILRFRLAPTPRSSGRCRGASGGLGVLASERRRTRRQGPGAEPPTSARAWLDDRGVAASIIPQLAFLDPTTASAIITEALKYELLDWWVDEGPTFNLASAANHGKKLACARRSVGLAGDRAGHNSVVQQRDRCIQRRNGRHANGRVTRVECECDRCFAG